MGYSSHYQIGQALHKEYEATYSATAQLTNSQAVSLTIPVKLISILSVMVATVTFVAQLFMA